MPTSKTATPTSIADIDQKALADRYDKIDALLDRVDEVMADAVELTADDRAHAARLRSGEEVALTGVLDYADARPEFFTTLADKDNGKDPSTFETKLLRQRIGAAAILQKIVDRLEKTRLPISDSALYVTTLAKAPVLAAYEIAKVHARHDDVHGKKLNAAINLYSSIAKAGAATRKSKKTT